MLRRSLSFVDDAVGLLKPFSAKEKPVAVAQPEDMDTNAVSPVDESEEPAVVKDLTSEKQKELLVELKGVLEDLEAPSSESGDGDCDCPDVDEPMPEKKQPTEEKPEKSVKNDFAIAKERAKAVAKTKTFDRKKSTRLIKALRFKNKLPVKRALKIENKAKAAKKTEGVVKKVHRWRPGTVALREIRKYQRYTGSLIPKLPLRRVIREIAQGFVDDVRFTESSLEALHEGTEALLSELFKDSIKYMAHAKRVTLMHKDFELARERQTAIITAAKFSPSI